jgi:HAMP domain-containing protein
LSPPQLQGFDLVAVIPTAEADRETDRLLGMAGPGVVLALLAGLICALLLSESLLVPLEDLGKGIAAFAARQTEVRLPVRGRDEMGRLAEAFNHMLEALGEIDLARTVQDSLVPHALPWHPGWRFDLRHHQGNRIGGTYGDVFPLPDGRLVFLIGEVHQTGVTAALVMAMAKTLAFLHVDESRPLADLLPRLDRTLGEIFSGQLLFSCCLGTIDPVSHRITLVAAGQPAIALPKGPAAQALILLGSPPLGRGSWRPPPETCFDLAVGQRLCIASRPDLLSEPHGTMDPATDPNGGTILLIDRTEGGRP